MNIPYSFTQPSVALTQSVIFNGVYPSNSQWGGGNNADSTAAGMIFTSAFPVHPWSDITNFVLPANGSQQMTGQYELLYAVIGQNYGGSMNSTVGMPALGGAMMVGSLGNGSETILGEVQGSPFPQMLYNVQLPPSLGGAGIPIQNQQYSQAVNYVIQAEGFYPMGLAPMAGMIGTVSAFLGPYTPQGFLECNGQLVSVQQFPLLFKVLGTTYGGDGVHWFGLPDLTESVPVGTGGQFKIGQTVGSSSVSLQPNLNGGSGAPFVPVSTMQPSLAMHFLIDTVGLYQEISQGASTIGQIVMYAGTDVPNGWVRCEGQLLPVATNQALFSLIGKNFGGDGITNFALPDLRDRAIVGTGGPTNLTLGQVVGQKSLQLTGDNLPFIFVPVPGLSLKTDTGVSGDDHITNIADVQVSGVWPNAKVEYSKDGATWTATLQAVEGNNTVYVRQLDYIGQASVASAPLKFILDTQAPTAPAVSLAPTASTNAVGPAASGLPTSTAGTLAFANIEKGAIIAYSIDGGLTWSEQFQAVPGVNTVQVRQTDVAGNVSAPSAAFSFNYLGTPGQTAQTSVSPLPDGSTRIDVSAPGELPSSVGTDGVNHVHFALQAGLALPDKVENAVLSGVGAGNTVRGNSSANNFTVNGGSWVIDGGANRDSVSISGKLADFAITTSKVGTAVQIIVHGENGKLVLQNIEQVNFADAVLESTSAPAVKNLNLLYEAVFDRAPDWSGLKGWDNALANGASLQAVASTFVASAEFSNMYGSAQTNANFITAMYQNGLGRNPDPVGLAAWARALDSNQVSRADVVIGIISSAEAQAHAANHYLILG